MLPYYQDKLVTLYHGDARQILPSLDCANRLLLTDPPYGIGLKATRFNNLNTNASKLTDVANDEGLFDLRFLFSYGYPQVIFGANNFPDIVPFNPKTDGWLVWDKRLTGKADRMLGSPFEMAVVRGKRLYKFIRLLHGGVVNADGHGIKRVHPTQKPVKLMTEVLKYFPGMAVLDPFAGAGGSLIAAHQEGRSAIGIELEEKYCAISASRLRQLQPFPQCVAETGQ